MVQARTARYRATKGNAGRDVVRWSGGRTAEVPTRHLVVAQHRAASAARVAAIDIRLSGILAQVIIVYACTVVHMQTVAAWGCLFVAGDWCASGGAAARAGLWELPGPAAHQPGPQRQAEVRALLVQVRRSGCGEFPCTKLKFLMWRSIPPLAPSCTALFVLQQSVARRTSPQPLAYDFSDTSLSGGLLAPTRYRAAHTSHPAAATYVR